MFGSEDVGTAFPCLPARKRTSLWVSVPQRCSKPVDLSPEPEISPELFLKSLARACQYRITTVIAENSPGSLRGFHFCDSSFTVAAIGYDLH